MTDRELDLLFHDARVVTCDPRRAGPLGVIDRGAVGVRAGRIVFVGDACDAPSAAREIDARGRILLPGLVDPHTHLVFAGSRVDEFSRRMAGEDYQAIAAEGGGIRATVRATRAADAATLRSTALGRVQAMRARGVTCVEIKSGYGLNTETELRLLRVARSLTEHTPLRVTTSLLGAHAIPPEFADDRAGYVRAVVSEMIPAAATERLADACDVYLDEGAFTRGEAHTILRAAKSAGLAVRAHVGQFADLGGAQLAAELGALSADHLEQVSDAGLAAMARAGVVAVLLPGAWRTLRQTPPDARRMRHFGVPVAVGTDCNPGTSPCVDLPLMASLAVRDAGLTAEEAILAMTRSSAQAAGVAGVGSIRAGNFADLVLYNEHDPRALAYGLGAPLARWVVVAGRLLSYGEPSRPPLW